MAEGLRDALVSRNSATTSHLKTRVPGLSCGIICRRTDRPTTTACTALSISSLRHAVKIYHRPIALPTKYNYQATTVG